MDFLTICLTSFFSYIVLFLMAKLLGHKQVSQLDFFDYITGITIGSIAAEFATELEDPWKPLVAMIIYALVTVFLSLIAVKFPRTRKLLNGKPSIIIENGRLSKTALKKAKLELNEFLMMCREQGYFDLNSIHTALFECNGKLSILPFSTHRTATPEDLNQNPSQELLFFEVIMDGRIIYKNLTTLGLDANWLSKQLKAQSIGSANDIFLAMCDKNRNITFYKNVD